MGCHSSRATVAAPPSKDVNNRRSARNSSKIDNESASGHECDSNSDRYSNVSVKSFSDCGSLCDHDDLSGPRPPSLHFLSDEDPKDKLVGVVISVYMGMSYDNMFRAVKPETVSGERVRVYSMSCADAGRMLVYLTGAPVPEEEAIWKQMMNDVQHVNADSVVLNWECCSACGDRDFPCAHHSHGHVSSKMEEAYEPEPETQENRPGASATINLIGEALTRGYTVMCSDFSLKSLIWEWSEQHLGPNPFVKMGACSGTFQLSFDPADLSNEEVPQQLQVVGELCKEDGCATVDSMQDTIVYTVNPQLAKTDIYNLKVLTVATRINGVQIPEHMKCSIGTGSNVKKGAAGHVTLTYSSGGQLVASMGHWIELTRLHTSFDAVRRVAAGEHGDVECRSFVEEWENLSTTSQKSMCVQRRAREYIHKSVPSRMKGKTKFYDNNSTTNEK